uniref:Uncharacterized protein n=1 Tax=Ammonifex degensii TaxID=42838 RepID=A0A7C2EJ11_9THEO
MRQFFSRMSYFTTLVVPMAVALIIAFLAVINPQWPRLYCIIAFLAALIILPGITLGLKLGCTPVTEEEVVFLGVCAPGVIGVRYPNGEVVRYPHRELYDLFRNGTVKEGDILRLRFLDKEIIGWQFPDNGETGD